MAELYSDLQVAPPHPSEYSGLQLPDYSGLHHSPAQTLYPEIASHTGQEYKDAEPQNTPSKRLICGLAAKSFWAILAVIVAIVVVGAAVGGGVGGSIVAKNNRNANSAASSPSSGSASTTAPASKSSASAGPITSLPASSSTGTSGGPITSPPANSSTSTPAVTTTQLPGPSTTLLRDCPSSNNTLYTVDIGSLMYFRKICNLSYRNSLNGYAVIDKPTTSLDDCIQLCAAYNVQNGTEIAAGTSDLCNAVCWRNTFTDGNAWPGQCFGYTTQNSSSSFVVDSESICDSAAWVNQSF